jgi:hypothetical protein
VGLFLNLQLFCEDIEIILPSPHPPTHIRLQHPCRFRQIVHRQEPRVPRHVDGHVFPAQQVGGVVRDDPIYDMWIDATKERVDPLIAASLGEEVDDFGGRTTKSEAMSRHHVHGHFFGCP